MSGFPGYEQWLFNLVNRSTTFGMELFSRVTPKKCPFTLSVSRLNVSIRVYPRNEKDMQLQTGTPVLANYKIYRARALPIDKSYTE
jgi:hypothetical protein